MNDEQLAREISTTLELPLDVVRKALFPRFPATEPVQLGAQSESVATLLSALATVQGQLDNVAFDREVEVPIKDKSNPGSFKGKYKYRYATLPGILNHIRPLMAANGLWYTQRIASGMMVTRLYHASGEWMDSGHIPLPNFSGGPQDIGSIVSYFKRYSLTAALGLAAEEDNDGEDAGANNSDRSISFQARGAARATASDVGDVEEPEMGWGDWTRGLIKAVQGKDSLEELDGLKANNTRLINAVKRIDESMYNDIGRAFTARRGILDKNQPV